MALTTVDIYKIYYPDTTLTDAQISAYIDITSEAIETYLNRDLELKTHNELHWMDEDNVIILEQYPVQQIYGVAKGNEPYRQFTITANASGTAHTFAFSSNVYNDVLTYSIVKDFNADDDETVLQPWSYANVSALATAIENDITTKGGIVQNIENSAYNNVDTNNLYDVSVQQGIDNLQIDLIGIDKYGQINYTREAERVIVLNQLINGSNAVLVKYKAGYTLPSGSDYGTLPREINDIANRIVKLITENDVTGGADLTYQREKLGNAEYANWSYENAVQASYVYGLVQRFAPQLDRYKRKDIGFY